MCVVTPSPHPMLRNVPLSDGWGSGNMSQMPMRLNKSQDVDDTSKKFFLFLNIFYFGIKRFENGVANSLTFVRMADHANSKTPKSFLCKECKFVGSSTRDLREHVELAHTDNPDFYNCDKCKYKTVRKRNLTAHMNSHNADHKAKKYSFQCSICDFVSRRKDDLRYHIQEAHTDNPNYFKCYKCEYQSIRKRYLASHLKTHNTDVKYECNLCDAKLKSLDTLSLHKRSIHKGIKFDCNICDKSFTQQSHLMSHKKSVHPDILKLPPIECDICSKLLKNREYLYKHKKRFHLTVYSDCKDCGRRLKSENLRHHVRTYHEGRPFLSCNQCDFKTKQNSNLKTHMINVHSMVKRVKCELCSHEFSKYSLKSHMYNVHTTHEKVKCNFCDYEGIKSNLATHTKEVHYAEKTEVCTICPFKTKRKVNLKKHINSVHLHEVAECDTCHKKISVQYLSEHMKRAHGNYVSHKCSLCGKIIKGQKYILKQHIDTVHKKKVKKFECDLCPFETHINMTLTKHKEALHLPKK